jgi:hypothetical protein
MTEHASWRHTGRVLGRVVGLATQVAYEQVRRAKPVDLREVPRSAEALTIPWLTAALCSSVPGAAVRSFELGSGSSGTSSRRAIAVAYNDQGQSAGLPTEVFVKSTSKLTQRLVLGMAQVIDGEIGFYGKLRQHVDIEAPRGYYADIDQRSWRSIILMEDVARTKGATFNTPQTRISRAAMEDLLANMAIWHARFWNQPELDSTYRWLKTPAGHLQHISRFIAMRKRSLIGSERARAVLPEQLRSKAAQDALWNGLEQAMARSSERPHTLLHGDSHIGNTYTTRDGRMGFADWQVTLKGNWGYDFAYTLTSGLAVEDRRQWERDLLKGYLDRLAAAGGPQLSFDQAWLNYRQQVFYAYFAWVFTIGHGPLQPNMQPDHISREIIERTAHALVDLESLEALAAERAGA